MAIAIAAKQVMVGAHEPCRRRRRPGKCLRLPSPSFEWALAQLTSSLRRLHSGSSLSGRSFAAGSRLAAASMAMILSPCLSRTPEDLTSPPPSRQGRRFPLVRG